MLFFSFPGGFLVLRIIKWRHVYPILFYSKRIQKFLSVCKDRQCTNNFWLNNVRVQFQLDFSPWFRPLKSLQSSTTNTAFRRKLSNKNLSYSWSYPPLNRHYKMTLVSQQFLIFKKYNSQETIFILELTWLKNIGILVYVTYEMYCQFINFS